MLKETTAWVDVTMGLNVASEGVAMPYSVSVPMKLTGVLLKL
ncbi:hypothetical protein CULC0102_1218 [Corynebacterium ulcerans 0102]|nr:hypothetical protein CULC0102_1218 [Corynebacterium ulcerans 0102]